jgi:hypothetical protein
MKCMPPKTDFNILKSKDDFSHIDKERPISMGCSLIYQVSSLAWDNFLHSNIWKNYFIILSIGL